MQSSRFDFDVISGPVPPRIPPKPAQTAQQTSAPAAPKPEGGK